MKGNFESLTSLAQRIEQIESSKNDFIINSTKLSMSDNERIVIPENGENEGQEFQVTDYMHGQIASKLQIPKQYYDRMEKIPGLRQMTVNAWLRHPERPNQQYMVRTVENNARALLSDRYKPFDNFLVLSAFLPAVQEHLDLKVMSCTLTETKLYLQFRFPKLEGEVKKDDIIQAGMILTNSEVGAGAVDVKAMTWRLSCTNGMISDSVLRKYHVGRSIGDREDDYDIFKDDTIQAELTSFKLKLRDVIGDALKETTFQDQLIRMRAAAEDQIYQLPETIENVTKRYFLSESDGKKILNNIASDGNINR